MSKMAYLASLAPQPLSLLGCQGDGRSSQSGWSTPKRLGEWVCGCVGVGGWVGGWLEAELVPLWARPLHQSTSDVATSRVVAPPYVTLLQISFKAVRERTRYEAQTCC